MIALINKEINFFFSNISAYLISIIFIIISSLFLFFFEGDFNIFDIGIVDLYPFFMLSSWLFIFLIPAITMNTFSDEKKTGTIELLLTLPITTFQIIVSKSIACITLVIFNLIPTLIYVYTIYFLSNSKNIDFANIITGYLGLILIAKSLISIGIFSSSLSNNSIISFFISLFISFFIFYGFKALGSYDIFGQYDYIITNISIIEHTDSIKKGVLDSRDILYFISIYIIFIYLTYVKIKSIKW